MKKIFLVIVCLSSFMHGMQFKKNISKNKNLFKKSVPQSFLNNKSLTSKVAPEAAKKEPQVLPSASYPQSNTSFQPKQSIQQFRNWIKGYYPKAIAPTGYYAMKFRNPQRENIASNKDHILSSDDNDSRLTAIIANLENSWTPRVRKDPRDAFFHTRGFKVKKDKKQDEKQVSQNWWIFGALASLFYGSQEDDEYLRYPEKFLKYALDGEMANSMDPSEFAEELHKVGLTVADAVAIQCQIQEDAAYEELTRVANLTAHDWNLLQNILDLKFQLWKGHYNENNITFDGDFSPEITTMVKDVLAKLDVPFKIRVHSDPRGEDPTTIGSAGLGNWSLSFNIPIMHQFFGWKLNLRDKTIGIDLYLSAGLTSLTTSPLEQKAVIAHEAMHIANLHSVQRALASIYFRNIKKLNVGIREKCYKILSRIFEYQAEALPLARPEFARAQLLRYRDYKNKGISQSDIYIPVDKMIALSSRAVALHKAEAILLSKPDPFEQITEEIPKAEVEINYRYRNRFDRHWEPSVPSKGKAGR